MSKIIKELYNYRYLLYMITWREIRIKYKQSIMGIMWAVLMPMIIVSAGVLVKYAFSRLSGSPFTGDQIATVSVKSIPWAFFVSSIRFASNSLIGNANLVTKIYMPREIFPIAAILSQFVDFIVATFVLTFIFCFTNIGVSVYLLWIPVIVAILLLFIMGLGIFVSAASLFFRDVKYLVEVFLTFAIFFTPVFYEVTLFGEWANILLLNPVAPLLESLNHVVVLKQSPDVKWLIYSAIVAVITYFLSYKFFKKLEPAFAESI